MGKQDRAAEAAPAGDGRTYRVTGPHRVHDTRPGETFTKHLDPGNEQFLLRTGHIEIVGRDGDDTASSDYPITDGADGGAEQEQ